MCKKCGKWKSCDFCHLGKHGGASEASRKCLAQRSVQGRHSLKGTGMIIQVKLHARLKDNKAGEQQRNNKERTCTNREHKSGSTIPHSNPLVPWTFQCRLACLLARTINNSKSVRARSRFEQAQKNSSGTFTFHHTTLTHRNWAERRQSQPSGKS